MGLYDLGSDGVLRSFDGPYKHNVIDAIGLSPAQIKELLDSREWSQEIEDRFRGVDGRKVTDPKALFECPEDSKPQEHTEESLKIAQAEVEEKNRKLMEQIAKEEREGVDVAAKYACGRAVSDFDLSPKVAK
jgi:DNA-binding transcriptional MerR regulator